MTTAAVRPSEPARAAGPGVLSVLVRRALRDARTRTISFAYLFAALAYIQPVAYRHTYPTLASRVGFAQTFAHNKALVLFYGLAHDLRSVGGYTAWRVGGISAVLAAVFGLLAAVRALATEEESGRTELVLATPVRRRTLGLASFLAIASSALALGVAMWAGLSLGGLPVAGAAYLALCVVAVIPVFAGIGALASQLAANRRVALELGGAAVALAFVLRVIADSSDRVGWLRWVTPLGWAEELRPFAGARPAVLLLFAFLTALLLFCAVRLSAGRDVGSGLLGSHERAHPRLRLLSSPTAQTLRGARAGLIAWLGAAGAFAFIVGVLAKSVSSAGISEQLQRELEKVGSGSIVHPEGYLGFSFLFFILAVSLFGVSQIAAARHEEADERLETVLALPVSRGRWLGGRLALAAGAASVIALSCGLLGWVGAASQSAGVSLPRMLEAGANCLPTAVLFLGLAALLYALVPRASTGVSYGLVAAAFLWQLFGSLFGAPRWLVDVTPFAHVGLVPGEAFRAGAAAIMAGLGVVCAIGAILLFAQRDLVGA